MKGTTETPEVSLVLSCYDRPDLLPMSLGSIYAQSMTDFVCLVTDNATDDTVARQHERIVKWYAGLDRRSKRAPRFLYVRTHGRLKQCDCYWSAEYGVERLRKIGRLGRWLGFPCDDTQYFPLHLQRVLAFAAKNLVDCVNIGLPVVSPVGATRNSAGYQVWELTDMSAKTTFLVRSKHFRGFVCKLSSPGAYSADINFTMDLRRRGVSYGVMNETTLCHN